MRGLTDVERVVMQNAMGRGCSGRPITRSWTPEEKAAGVNLKAMGRVRPEPCPVAPDAHPNGHWVATPAGRLAYELDNYARGIVKLEGVGG